jgi:cytochrome c
MKAFVAYIKFLSTGRPIGAKTYGRGSGQITELSRPADPVAGARVFAQNCAACHGDDGLGKRAGIVGDARGYEFPPLWGPDSFNDGAGMGHLISAANFIHSNMPNGTSYDQPVLSVDEAWDIAAYVESMKRPQKAGLDKDFPVRAEKPRRRWLRALHRRLQPGPTQVWTVPADPKRAQGHEDAARRPKTQARDSIITGRVRSFISRTRPAASMLRLTDWRLWSTPVTA